MDQVRTRLSEARTLAKALLEEMECSNPSASEILMKAKRLARLMRDSDAQAWLEYEVHGYPSDFNFRSLGTCEKYVVASKRVSEQRYFTQSLPEMETWVRTEEGTIIPVRMPEMNVNDYTAKGATQQLINTLLNQQNEQKRNIVEHTARVISIKGAVHQYVTDVYLAIELGDAVQDIFEAARQEVDNFVRVHCPKSAEQLVAMNERLLDNVPESRSAALTSCRRLLMTVADSVFPAQKEPWTSPSGKQFKVGIEQYKNRLLAFVSERAGGTSLAIIQNDLEHLAARLDALYDKACKGVHAEVGLEEARLTVIQTYLFLAELARVAAAKPPGPPKEPESAPTSPPTAPAAEGVAPTTKDVVTE